ncbi:MAG: rhodanese-like domain-containing protein [Desulfobacterales bacterium]
MNPAIRFFRFSLPCIGLAWALSMGHAPPGRAADGMSDAEKRAKIEVMYRAYKNNFAEVEDIETAAAMRLLEEGKALFIDVREEREQNVSMLPSAVTEKEFLKDPAKYEGRTLIGYCTISYRSGKLAARLKKEGIPILNLRGGLLAWVHDGGKVYDRGSETRRINVYGRKWNLGPKDYEAVW